MDRRDEKPGMENGAESVFELTEALSPNETNRAEEGPESPDELRGDIYTLVEEVVESPNAALLSETLLSRMEEITRRVAEKIVPELAEKMIREEIEKLKKDTDADEGS